MVHSGSASPMKTSPSASPHLTVPPLRAARGDAPDQETPSKLLKTDLTANPDSTQAPLLPPDAIITLTKALSSSSRSTSGSPTPVQTPVNGRTSGRKRTPKACDCCGPNSAGHNVATPGRSRGRGRGRGAGSNGLDAQKRKLTQIRSFKEAEETDDESDSSEEARTTTKVAKTELRQPVAAASKQDGPARNLPASIKDDVQKKEGFRIGYDSDSRGRKQEKEAGEKGGDDSIDVEKRLTGATSRGAPGVRGRGRGGGRGFVGASAFQRDVQKKEDFTEEKGGEGKDVEKRLTGTPGRGRGGGGRGFVGASCGLKAESDSGTKKGAPGGGALAYKPFTAPLSMLVQGLETKKDPVGKVKPAFENGETVDLSDSEPEEEVKNGGVAVGGEVKNGVLSASQRPESPLDMDSVTHVDLTPDKTDSDCESITLSNGDIVLQPSEHHLGLMEAEASSRPAKVVPEFVGPIAVSSSEHGGALRDHSLYCQTGTWEEDAGEEELRPEEKEESEESRERLTDMVHEFLESFYIKYGGFIPLTETDVLEHLKKKGNFDLCNKELDIKGDVSRYRAALASAPVAGFMVTHNKHTLSLEDLGTLEEQNWLNDQIINMYGELIMEATQQKVHFFNSFFHKQLVAKGYEGVKRWTKKVDLFSKSLLLIPIHLEIHWSLVTVNMATKTISYYDSQGIVFRHTTDNILKYILSEAKEKKQAAFQKSWKVNIIKGIPQQKNDSDCGVFVLEYCRCLSLKKPLTFSQDDMPRIRKRIYKELCDCRLSD